MDLDDDLYALLTGSLNVYDGQYAVTSPTSRKSRKEYDESWKGRARTARYRQGESYRAAKHALNHTEKQREHRRKYAKSEKGRASNREAVRRYYYKMKALKEAGR